MAGERFNADYYLRGPELEISNYHDYRWLPTATLEACAAMMSHLGASYGESVLDFGCARGYYVRALRMLGYEARGCDISRWAVENCDPTVRDYVGFKPTPAEWLLCKDTLEHVPQDELSCVFYGLLSCAMKGALLIVPLADESGEYLNPADRRDITHVIRWTLGEWLAFIKSITYRHVAFTTAISGVKEAAAPGSCGFITVR